MKSIFLNPKTRRTLSKATAFLFLCFASIALLSCKEQASTKKPADVDYYTCSMHPSVRKMSPTDKCPICSMDLTPVKKGAAAHEHSSTNAQLQEVAHESKEEVPSEFSIPPKRLQQIGVTFDVVGKQPFKHTLRVPGIVAYDKEHHFDFVARVDGFVQKLFVFSSGELVEKDAPLLTLYSPDLLTTQNEFIEVLRMRDEARTNGNKAVLSSSERLYDSAKQRLKLWNVAEREIAELEASRKPKENLTLYSPFSGVVQDVAVDQGRRVMTGEHLIDVADLRTVWVWAEFYQDDISVLKGDLPVTISSSSYPGEIFTGKISLVDPFIKETRRTTRARIDVENAGLKLRPQMYVDVELVVDSGEGIAVPVSAVIPTGKRNIAFVDKGEGKLEPRFLELGRKFSDFYEVKSGLTEGERVVTSGNFLIDAEAKVQGALKSW